MSDEVLLEVKDLETCFTTDQGIAKALSGVNFKVKKGQTLGIVGESGCGKSVTSLSIMRLLPKPAGNITGGEILFKGENLVTKPASEMHKIRGNRISMIFQEPMTALNPVHKISRQLGECFLLHDPSMSKEKVKEESIKILEKVGIPAPEKRLNEYPHQLSGGMRQRVMISMALACKPDILIADEPTTALDVTIQAQILHLMKELQKETGMAIIFITHDLGVIAELCDEVLVMYSGKAVEEADVYTLFENPQHPYTQGLLKSIPRLESEPKSKLDTIEGMVPSLFELPQGCRFANRCQFKKAVCEESSPNLSEVNPGHYVSCYKFSGGGQ